MSRYRGPRLRLMRGLGMELPGLSRKSIERRPYAPGQHRGEGRRKVSTFGLQLKEKQKLRFNFGLTEKQLKRYVNEAFHSRGNRAEILLQMVERRLDNVVFRAGLAPTIPAARQLVGHGHVKVNGKRVDIPSYRIKAGEEFELTEKALKMPVVVEARENPSLKAAAWLMVDPNTVKVKVTNLPSRDSFPFALNEQLIVEYYSQRT